MRQGGEVSAQGRVRAKTSMEGPIKSALSTAKTQLKKIYSPCGHRRLKWFLCFNENGNGTDSELFKEAQVAVVTAKATNDLEIHLIYDGDNEGVIGWFKSEGVRVHKLESSIKKHVLSHQGKLKGNPRLICGTFLRLEIPRVVRDILKADDEHVLYTDTDVIFMGDVTRIVSSHKPAYLGLSYENVGPEQKNHGEHAVYNTGSMVINVTKMRGDFDAFMRWCTDNLTTIVHDQDAINRYYAGRMELASPLLNWKPYWGKNKDAAIIHFHGPKPTASLKVLLLMKGYKLRPLCRGSFFHDFDNWQNIHCRIQVMPKSGKGKPSKGHLPKDFDWEQYILANPDLSEAGIDNRSKAEDHWLRYGLNEGRTYRKT